MAENAKKGVARLTSLFYASSWGWEGDPSFQLESTHLGTSLLVGSHETGQARQCLNRSFKGNGSPVTLSPLGGGSIGGS
uniref:Uncharacterized protein n=1 Tax=Bionectria ochroleuca TaxID=29856 RepID=A0A0B7KEU5_BIOOC